MHVSETRVAIAATLTGLVLATGIGAAAAPSTPPAVTPATIDVARQGDRQLQNGGVRLPQFDGRGRR